LPAELPGDSVRNQVTITPSDGGFFLQLPQIKLEWRSTLKAFVDASAILGPDPVSQPRRSAIVVNENGRIESVGDDVAPVSETWEIIDCGGQVATPFPTLPKPRVSGA
jgi:hypothetical protein